MLCIDSSDVAGVPQGFANVSEEDASLSVDTQPGDDDGNHTGVQNFRSHLEIQYIMVKIQLLQRVNTRQGN
jgi:hypothetical protein